MAEIEDGRNRSDVRLPARTTASRMAWGWRALAWPRASLASEAGVIGLFYLFYAAVRAVTPTDRDGAVSHAHDIMHVEQRLGLDFEPSLNHLINSSYIVATSAGFYYAVLHFVVTPAVLLWLWLRRPAAYGWLRSGLVLTSFVALAIFWLYPVAPPRLAQNGVIDTVTRHGILGMDGQAHGVSGLVNLYAAFPSLHVAWAAWCAIAIVSTTHTLWRHLAWLYPLGTTVVVLGTGNHYLLDAVAGVALLAAVLLVNQPAAAALAEAGSYDVVDLRRTAEADRPGP